MEISKVYFSSSDWFSQISPIADLSPHSYHSFIYQINERVWGESSSPELWMLVFISSTCLPISWLVWRGIAGVRLLLELIFANGAKM